MICPNCKARHASFPREDFKLIPGKGFVALNVKAEAKRGVAFDSNKREYCLTCIKEIQEGGLKCY